MLTEESIASAEREARRRETQKWVEYVEGVIESNRPAFERRQARLVAEGVLDANWKLIKRELPKDMQAGSGSDVGG